MGVCCSVLLLVLFFGFRWAVVLLWVSWGGCVGWGLVGFVDFVMLSGIFCLSMFFAYYVLVRLWCGLSFR